MPKQAEQLPELHEHGGQLLFIHKDVQLILHQTSLMRSMALCKEVSASIAQRLLASFNLDMPLITPREIFAPLVMSFVQLAWHRHFHELVGTQLLERHERRIDRYKLYLYSGKMPGVTTQKSSGNGIRQASRERLYTIRPGTKQRGGQLGLVIAALSKLGPSNISQITAEIIRLGLKTCQPAERITRYYVVTRLNKEIIDATANEVRKGKAIETI